MPKISKKHAIESLAHHLTAPMSGANDPVLSSLLANSPEYRAKAEAKARRGAPKPEPEPAPPPRPRAEAKRDRMADIERLMGTGASLDEAVSALERIEKLK